LVSSRVISAGISAIAGSQCNVLHSNAPPCVYRQPSALLGKLLRAQLSHCRQVTCLVPLCLHSVAHSDHDNHYCDHCRLSTEVSIRYLGPVRSVRTGFRNCIRIASCVPALADWLGIVTSQNHWTYQMVTGSPNTQSLLSGLLLDCIWVRTDEPPSGLGLASAMNAVLGPQFAEQRLQLGT